MELVNARQLAEHFGVHKGSVSQWITRRDYNGFPLPVQQGRGSRDLYDLQAVIDWRVRYRPRRNKIGGAPISEFVRV